LFTSKFLGRELVKELASFRAERLKFGEMAKESRCGPTSSSNIDLLVCST
jgi:hypothetical protein